MLSAFKGDLVLKGHLDSDIEEETILNFLCNHIGASVYVNGEIIFMDAPSEIKNYEPLNL